jgi:hypothetical protein
MSINGTILVITLLINPTFSQPLLIPNRNCPALQSPFSPIKGCLVVHFVVFAFLSASFPAQLSIISLTLPLNSSQWHRHNAFLYGMPWVVVIFSSHIACVQRRRPGVPGLNGEGTGKFPFDGMNIEGTFPDFLMVVRGECRLESLFFVRWVEDSLCVLCGVVMCDIGCKNVLHSVQEHEMFRGMATEIMLVYLTAT